MQLRTLYALAKKSDIAVEDFPLPHTRALSLMDPAGECIIGIDRAQIRSDGEEKMLLAHELGHCLRGEFRNPYSPLDLAGRHEFRADAWSIRMLLPRSELKSAMEQGFTDAWQLAEYFSLPQEFIEKALAYYENRE